MGIESSSMVGDFRPFFRPDPEGGDCCLPGDFDKPFLGVLLGEDAAAALAFALRSAARVLRSSTLVQAGQYHSSSSLGNDERGGSRQ